MTILDTKAQKIIRPRCNIRFPLIVMWQRIWIHLSGSGVQQGSQFQEGSNEFYNTEPYNRK